MVSNGRTKQIPTLVVTLPTTEPAKCANRKDGGGRAAAAVHAAGCVRALVWHPLDPRGSSWNT